MTTATAAVLKDVDQKLVLEEVEVGAPQEGEVLVRMVGVGICHTDVSVIEGSIPLPFPSVLGHEGSGVIEAVGEGVTNVAPGDHVVLSFGHCGDCDNCNEGHPAYCDMFAALNYFGTRLDGTTTMQQSGEDVHGNFFAQSSFATYAIAGATNAVKVDKELPLELLGPLGCGLQTGSGTVINSLAPKAGESIAIFGLGGVGLSAVMAAAALGCDPIIAVDLNEKRLELAKELGATVTINPNVTKDVEWAIQEAAAPGVHYSVDAVGAEVTIHLAVKALRTQGTCATVGFGGLEHYVKIDQGHLILGRKLIGVVEGDSDPQKFIPELLELYKAGKFPIEKLIKTFPFEQINEAIEATSAGEVIKPVIVF